jgi:hypothetical protein
MRLIVLWKTVVSVILILSTNILSAQKINLTGIVKAGSETLQFATVSIADQSTLTDRHGRFSIAINPGTYSIIITYTGYKKIEANIAIIAGKENKVHHDAKRFVG